MTAAFLIALVLGGGLSGVFAALWKGVLGVLAAERAAHEATKSTITAASKAVEIAEAAQLEIIAQYDAAMAAKRVDILALEADNHACNSPALVRERLRKLAAAPVIPPYGGVQK